MKTNPGNYSSSSSPQMLLTKLSTALYENNKTSNFKEKFLILNSNLTFDFQVVFKAIHLISIMGNDGTFNKPLTQILLDWELSYNVLYLLLCISGLCVHPFFFSGIWILLRNFPSKLRHIWQIFIYIFNWFDGHFQSAKIASDIFNLVFFINFWWKHQMVPSYKQINTFQSKNTLTRNFVFKGVFKYCSSQCCYSRWSKERKPCWMLCSQ